MTWTKLDDGFHGHPKIKRVWRNPIAFGLHVLAINYSASYDLDGEVTPELTEDLVPDRSDRVGAIRHLVACGLWDEREDGGWQIHDYLEYHPSRAQVNDKRAKDARRKRESRANDRP